jgi:hypothetical protein
MPDEYIPEDFNGQELAVREDTGDPVRSDQLLETFGVDVEEQVKVLKKVAELAPEIVKYRSIVIKSFTYPGDWVRFGSGEKAKACCSNHAVMRIVDKANFPIRYRDVRGSKEDIFDKEGNIAGYRYVYEGYGDLGQRNVFAIGQYSTRDAFLGKSGGNWRDWREINESHIRQAAHSYFKGNVVKDLLGLKALPWDEFEKLCSFAGQVAEKATSVNYHQGAQGGSSEVDRTTRNSLYDELLVLASENKVVKCELEDGKIRQFIGSPSDKLIAYGETQDNYQVAYARSSLKALTTWVNDKGNQINGKDKFEDISPKQLKVLTETVLPRIMKGGTDDSPF